MIEWRGGREGPFEALLEAAPDAIVIVDAEGRIVIVNGQTERLFGYSRQELLGQPVEVLIPARFARAHRAHRREYASEPHVRPMGEGLSLAGVRKDGTEFPVEISLSPLQTAAGRLVTAAVRDVTDRTRVERALQEKNVELAAALDTKDRFLATMSHELRTPLNAIIGFTGTLLMRLPGPLTPDQESQLRTVQSSAHHLLSLINDLLDLAKIESGRVELRPESVRLSTVFDHVTAALSPSAVARGLALASRADEGCAAWTDRRALTQVLLNLVGNAVKFTERGSVTIVATRITRDTQPAVRIDVIDTGVGIRPQDRERLFRAFTQLDTTAAYRHEGTGLGLHLSARLVALLGGELDVMSVFGEGSTFTFTLPEGP